MQSMSAIPIIELWGNLLVPLQGEILDSQTDELEDRLLLRVRDRAAQGLVIDVSGVWIVDSHLCATLGRMAAAARLMGTRPVLCGLGPAVVMTLQTMGFDLEGIETALGLEEALDRLGVQPARGRTQTTHPESDPREEG
jgi:rsbT antagonist protein RsbS